jgi:heme-degrading monooxygenase HmoA
MISRHWKGVVKPGLAAQYIEHLQTQTFPALAEIAGFISASILRRNVADGTEFEVVTLWESLESIRAFAGDDIEAAVVPDTAARMMTSFERRVLHYEVVVSSSSASHGRTT